MKFDQLRSIAHNIADSLASGVGLLIGVYETNVFGEAARSPEGFITVDFLNGTAAGGAPSPSLARALALYRDALAELCAKHGTTPSAFRELNAATGSMPPACGFVSPPRTTPGIAPLMTMSDRRESAFASVTASGACDG